MKNENQLLIKVVFITTLIFILSLLENIYEQTHTRTQARTHKILAVVIRI